MFIPPINLGQFQPSPATIAEWVYQIWQFLQENPIATEEEIRTFIQSELTESTTLSAAIEDYLTENPPPAPVQSVQGKTGAVQLAYNDIVTSSNAVPVYKASSTPSASTLTGQYNLGYRLFVNTTTQEIYTISPAGALSLVGKGKFDGTTIDVNSTEGDTTIAEAIAALSVTDVTTGQTAPVTDDSGTQHVLTWTRYQLSSNLIIIVYDLTGGYTVNGNSTSEFEIAYPETFASAPHVQITSYTGSSSPLGCPVSAVSYNSTTSCKIKYFNQDTAGRAPSPKIMVTGLIS